MAIYLASEREQVVRSLMQGGRYASEDELIGEALRLLREQHERTAHLEALRQSAEDMRAGRLIPAEEMLAEMKRMLDDIQVP